MNKYRNIALFLVLALLINPVILFLLSKSVLFVAVCVISVLSTFWVVDYKAPRLLPYYFNFIFLIGLFIQAEAIFSFVYQDYNIRDLYNVRTHYYFNKPFLKERFIDKEYIVDYVTNSEGYRIGAEDDPSVATNTADWLFLGDSYTQGAQVANEQLYTSLLYESFPNKIIVNAGISGFGIADEYNFYMNEGAKLKSKKVFLQICNFNDFMKVEERTSNPTDYLMNFSNLYRYLVYPVKFANPAQLPLGRWTEPFYPTEKANEDFNIFYKKTSETKAKDLANFKLFLSRLNDEVTRAGAELIVLQIPTKEQLYYRYLQEVTSEFKLDIKQYDMNFPNKFCKNLCVQNKIKYLDLTEEFSASDTEVFFEYDEHLNVNGHRLMANAVSKLLRADDIRIQHLSTNNAGDRYPNFSSDGNSICFQSVRDGNMELFTADKELSQQRRLTYNQIDEIHPTFLDNDSKIVFTEGSQQEGTTKIGLIDLINGSRTYRNKYYYGAIASVSRDNHINSAQWTRGSDGKMTNPVIITTDLNNGDSRIITSEKYESWRPVQFGDSLVYISKRQGTFKLYLYNLKSRVESQLTFNDYDIWDPNFSPDGSEIVFSGKLAANWDLFSINLRTGIITRLTDTKGDEWDAVYSPDGKYIYFAGVFGLRNGIYRMPRNMTSQDR